MLGTDSIQNQAGAYRLTVADGELDAARFEADLVGAQSACQQGDLRRGAAVFERGLGRWHGRALADVDDAPWAQGEIARLEELRLGAVEALLDTKLALGLHREMTAPAEAAVNEQPLRERRWATLMLVLYRSGRQADALRAYRRLRSLLDEQLGIEPSPELAALEEAVILQSPELDWPGRPVGTRGTRRPAVDAAVDERTAPVARRSPPAGLAAGREAGRASPDEETSVIPLAGELQAPGRGAAGRQSRVLRSRRRTGPAAGALRRRRPRRPPGGPPRRRARHRQDRADGAGGAGGRRRGGAVLYGRCHQNLIVPYQPFVQALDHYVRHAPAGELEVHVDQFGGELLRLVPTLGRRVPDAPPPTTSDPDTERYLTFGAVVGLLGAACRYRPALVVLDDLHWAEPATLQLLRHVVAATPRLPLLVLGTFRSDETTPEHPLSDALAALWREDGLTRIDLAGLSRDDVLSLCSSAAGQVNDEQELSAFVDELRSDTGGNPFFVWELLRHLVESGGLVRDEADRWSTGDGLHRTGLPQSVREVIGQRVRRLGARAERLLSLAAVIGVEFDPIFVARLADLGDGPVLELLETAERAALLDEVGDRGTFVFSHALIRNTLYDAVLPTRRRQLHARVADALLEAQGAAAPPALLAHHYSASGEQGPALRYAELAGLAALDAMAPDEAAHWLAEARALVAEVEPDAALLHCDLTTHLGVAQLLAGDPSYRDTLLEAVVEAEGAGDPRRMALAALANSRGYYSSAGETDRARLDALRRTLDLLGDGDDRLRVRLLATLCSEMVFGSSLAERRSVACQAKWEARRLGDPATMLEVENLVTESLRFPTELAGRLEDTGGALELADELADPAALFWAVSHRMRALLEAGRFADAVGLRKRMAAIADEVGQPVMRWMALFSGAEWAFLRGETAEGERLATEALDLGVVIGQPDAFNSYATQVSHARWQQGRLGELVELIETGARDNPGIPGYGGALARAYCQAGRNREARSLLDRGAADGFADLPQDVLWTYGMVAFAEAALRLGHTRAAVVLYNQLEPFADQFAYLGTTCEGAVARYLGGLAIVLDRDADAERHLAAAAVLAGPAGSPFFGARTTIESGRLAARRGDTTTARALLSDGRQLAARWGFTGEVAWADTLLAPLG